jgi:hypothetical protein
MLVKPNEPIKFRVTNEIKSLKGTQDTAPDPCTQDTAPDHAAPDPCTQDTAQDPW